MSVVSHWWVIGACGAYALVAAPFIKYRVAWPREWLLERVAYIKPKIGDPKVTAELEKLIKRIDRPWYRVTASGLQPGWRHIHALEEDLIRELPEEAVAERLQSAHVRLQAFSTPEAKSLQDRVGKALATPPKLRRRAELLREATAFLNHQNDSVYEQLAGVVVKAAWLAGLALAGIIALTLVLDRETFFLLGAAGALVSRLVRVLRSAPKSSDWGARRASLILAIPAGALAGWLGVLLVTVLAEEPLDVLSTTFAGLWDKPEDELALVVAFLFGFSERFFDRVLGLAETKVIGLLPEEQKQSAA